jgi:hypothetical protein
MTWTTSPLHHADVRTQSNHQMPQIPRTPMRGFPTRSGGRGLTVGVEERLPTLVEALPQGIDRHHHGGVLLLELRHGREPGGEWGGVRTSRIAAGTPQTLTL